MREKGNRGAEGENLREDGKDRMRGNKGKANGGKRERKKEAEWNGEA